MTKGEPSTWLPPRLSAHDVVYDVGANVGYCTEAFLKTGARVYAIEPDPRCWPDLQQRAKGAIVMPVAAAAFAGKADLTLAKASMQNSLRPSAVVEPIGTESVFMMPLDEIDATPTAVKIDVQGCELDVLRGATHCLSVCRLWVVEVWPWGLPEGAVEEMYDLFAVHGLEPYQMEKTAQIVHKEALLAWAASAERNTFANIAWIRL